MCDGRSSPSLPGAKRAAGPVKPLGRCSHRRRCRAPELPQPVPTGHGWRQGAGGHSGGVPAPDVRRRVTVTGAVWGHPPPAPDVVSAEEPVKAGSISPPAALGQVAEPGTWHHPHQLNGLGASVRPAPREGRVLAAGLQTLHSLCLWGAWLAGRTAAVCRMLSTEGLCWRVPLYPGLSTFCVMCCARPR